MEHAIEPYLNSAALVLLLTIIIAGIYLVIYIHDIPYEIAKKRNHPHQDAFHIAGWVSLFLMHTIWPVLWIWAYWYKPEGEEVAIHITNDTTDQNLIEDLKAEVASLKEEITELTNTNNQKI